MVMGPPSTVHADPDARLRQVVGERQAGKLRALVGVEDQRLADPQRLVQTIQAKVGLQGVRELPGRHLAAIPIQNRHPVDEPPAEPDVRNVGTPHLIRAGDRHPTEQVRVEAVIGIRPRQRRFRVDRRQPHPAHQPQYPLTIHRVPGPAQHRGHSSAAVERMGGVFLVQAAHQFQIQRARFGRRFVPRTPAQPQ